MLLEQEIKHSHRIAKRHRGRQQQRRRWLHTTADKSLPNKTRKPTEFRGICEKGWREQKMPVPISPCCPMSTSDLKQLRQKQQPHTNQLEKKIEWHQPRNETKPKIKEKDFVFPFFVPLWLFLFLLSFIFGCNVFCPEMVFMPWMTESSYQTVKRESSKSIGR